MPQGPRYDDDFDAWTQHQATVLREMTVTHLLKLAYSPAEPPRFLWMASIVQARPALSDKLSPALRRDAEAVLPKLYEDARDSAALTLRSYGEIESSGPIILRMPLQLQRDPKPRLVPAS